MVCAKNKWHHCTDNEQNYRRMSLKYCHNGEVDVVTLYRSRTVLHLNDLILKRAVASKWQLQGIGHRKLVGN